LFVHCTAGDQNTTPQQLLDFFYRVKKWSRPGYHYVVSADGSVTQLWPESKYSNGVKGMNPNSINVAWIGGVDKQHPNGIDNRTQAQKVGLRNLLTELKRKYPKAIIMGHRDTSPDKNHNGIIDPWERIKECPCFDAMVEYKDL
jgi:N-acetyl-anhydromuramyl-L-alanine amidase AmpD